jgi:uncharacterized protein YggE
MRKLFHLFLSVMCTVLFVISTSSQAQTVRLISVSGMAKKKLKANVAFVTVAVWGKGKDAKSAQQNGMQAYKVFEDAIAKSKVNKDDIKTIWFDLSPESVYNSKLNKYVTVGYLSTQSILVKLEDVNEVGTFIDSLTDLPMAKGKEELLGLNVHSPQFDLKDKKEIEKNLKIEAVKNAESEAKILAEAAGVKLDGVYRLTPNGQERSYGYMEDAAAESGGMAAMKAAAPIPTKITPGEINLEARVSVEYLIK